MISIGHRMATLSTLIQPCHDETKWFWYSIIDCITAFRQRFYIDRANKAKKCLSPLIPSDSARILIVLDKSEDGAAWINDTYWRLYFQWYLVLNWSISRCLVGFEDYGACGATDPSRADSKSQNMYDLLCRLKQSAWIQCCLLILTIGGLFLRGMMDFSLSISLLVVANYYVCLDKAKVPFVHLHWWPTIILNS